MLYVAVSSIDNHHPGFRIFDLSHCDDHANLCSFKIALMPAVLVVVVLHGSFVPQLLTFSKFFVASNVTFPSRLMLATLNLG